jgi:tetratricopeptide (TPR) repeat protein
LLREADRLIASGDLLTPPGGNAFEDLQKVLQKDPENERGLELLGQIAAQLRGEAEQSLGKGELVAAGEKANQALLVAPEDVEVQALVKRIAEEQEQREVAARVDELLLKAKAAEDRQQRTGPDGAYALVRTALSLTPLDPEVQTRLKAVTDAEFARVREQIRAGDAQKAGEVLAGLQAEFGSDPAYAALDQEIRQAQASQQNERRIAELLDKAGTALAAGRISEPTGNNAFDWFEQARQVDRGNAKVNAFKQALAARILGEAQAAQDSGDVETSLDRAELALRVDPDLAGAVQIRDAAQKSLGSQRAAIASQLNLARSSIASGRLLPPASDNARDVIDQLLTLDPQNADALKLREALPRVVADALRGAIERNDLDYATSLAVSAAQAYPADSKITGLIGDVRKREAALKVEQAQQASEKQLATLLQKRPMSAEDASAAAQTIMTLRAVDGAGSARFEAQLEKVLADDVQNARTLEAGIAGLDAVNAARSKLRDNERLGTIVSTATASVAALQKQRDAEAAARNGELVINALPWGLVDQVLDASRKPVDLPSERSTPLLLNVPAGSYYVTLRHPQSAKSVSTFARVTAGKRSQASGSFPTLSAEEYINRAGL